MFNRARLNLTLLYALLLGVTVFLVAGAIGVLSVQEARQTDDRELQIRAAAVETALPPEPPPSAVAPLPPPPPGPDRRPRLEEQGVLVYVLPAFDGIIRPPPFNTLPGLPDQSGAQQALQSGSGRYETLTVQGNQVRVFSLPVVRAGRATGVVQVVRSRYFVNAAVSRLALIAAAAGIIGLLVSAPAGYWLAGRTLRPISIALERQRDFAADASHELRTPLTVLLTNAELLTRHPERLLADYQDVVADMIAEIERLSRMVADLLMLARADQGKAALALKVVDLSDIATSLGRQFAPIAAAKGIELRVDAEVHVFVNGDADRIQQLGVILLDNAVRYTTHGAIGIRVERESGDGTLAVSDTGPGIAPEHLPHLFERFYRTDEARSAEDGGTGLGLALAKWIVGSHRGRIDVETIQGEGSTFRVRLPAVTGGRAIAPV